MNLRIPRTGAIALAATMIVAAALFLFLLARFGGPSIRLSAPYTVSARFDDTKGLAPRSEVLVRGVHVGEVEAIDLEGGLARVKLAIDGDYAPLRRDAKLRIGEKTLFGEAYVELIPGPSTAPEMPDGSQLSRGNVLPATLDIDQALSVLDPPARRHLTNLIGTAGQAVANPAAAAQLSDTLAGLASTTSRLRRITDLLRGQGGRIAGGVSDARTVVGVLGSREESLRGIVSGGRATLEALASRSSSVRRGVEQLPTLESTASRTLADARPLLREARPLARDVAAAAPDLNAALVDLRPVVGDTDTVLAGVPRLYRQALPFLRQATAVMRLAQPVAGPLGAALRNLTPIATYLSARRSAFAAWFTNTGDLGSHRDAKGYFARFFVGFDPETSFGAPSSFETNAYTGPNDAAANRPYSGYPRLEPYNPPAEGSGAQSNSGGQ